MYCKIVQASAIMKNFYLMTAAVKKVKNICTEFKLRMMWKSAITSVTFDIDQLSDKDGYRQCRFKKNDVRTIAGLFEWGGRAG